MLHTRKAWAYAAMGRTATFQRATTQAAEAMMDAQPGEEPYWIAYFNEAELAITPGGRLLDLADLTGFPSIPLAFDACPISVDLDKLFPKRSSFDVYGRSSGAGSRPPPTKA
ncbi:hypothetical protein ACIBAG_35060 [Streptomyces sp. NPDC051243]|uniref:hypothetical protein n=1 Tax=Streptomyces sp. NPDC051243 TaxID=3365646 RepID=UPI00379C5D77